jgi:hypothetical protein
MIWQDKAFLAFYFLVIIIAQCFWQAALFKRNMPISHFWHGVYYCLTILPMMYFFMPVWWAVVLIGVTERLALFDFILNKIRSKPLWYNGRETTNSLQDQLENELSALWVKVLKVVYVLIFVTVLILL